MNNLLVHIGYHKTGTTWLQNNVFIDSNSTFYALSRESNGASTLADSFILDSDGYMLSMYDQNKEAIEKEITLIETQKATLKHKFPVLSHEELSGNPHSGGFMSKSIADRLKSIFPQAQILIVIREQKSFILSNYFQYLKIGGNKSLREILHTGFDKRIPFFSPNNIRYYDLISYYFHLFGKDKVLVLPYEMFQQTPETFIKEIGTFINKSIEVPASSFSKKENSKENLFIQYHFRSLNLFTKKISVNNYSSAKNRATRRLALIFLGILKLIIPKNWDKGTQQQRETEIKMWVKNRYSASNDELSKLIGIDLKQYGY